MKTPDDIKKGALCCAGVGQCNECPYDDVWHPLCIVKKSKDALAYIQQLEAERDAAVETIYEMAKCITEDVCEWCDGVECERLCMMHTIERPGFKWRGVQKEE